MKAALNEKPTPRKQDAPDAVTPTGDLTTTRAPFIEEARSHGELFIEQPYALYSAENQETWRRLYAAIEPKWRRFAGERFLEGLERLALRPDRIPRLEEINRRLEPLSGFAARAVSGYVPAYLFFECLRRRQFPTTITIRSGDRLDYLPEPDIFHDLAGHVPMHTDPVFAGVLVRLGEVARRAARLAAEIPEPRARTTALESTIKAMARFFWFTVEFGLMRRTDGDLCAYGSGLLSSSSELEHAVVSPQVQRYPFRLEWVVNQYFEIDHWQPLLFVIDSLEQLYDEVDRLDTWVAERRLENVSPGEPAIDEEDLRSFLEGSGCLA
jgi:phenylalanine-4-hydroxylase